MAQLQATTVDGNVDVINGELIEQGPHGGSNLTGGVLRYGQTYVVPGSFDDTEVIPPFFIGVGSTEAKSIVGAKFITQSGSCTVSVEVNGSTLSAPYDAISCSTTASTVSGSVALSDGDQLQLVVDASSSPVDLSFTLFLESTAA